MEEASASHPVGMVVDDDALVRESVAEVLEDDLCDHVYRASDGVEGLEMLDRHPEISVVVTDIAMPRLDGVAFASRARALHPGVKVLFLSGQHRPPPAEQFLPKPIRLGALVSAVRRMVACSNG
jgi:CheY-like chemotaxis protein